MNIIPTAQFLGPSPLRIGDYYQGGIIAYLGPIGSGSLSIFPNQLGFVVSTEFIPTTDPSGLGYFWGVFDELIPGATGSAIGTGATNTQYILDYYGSGNTYAAQVAANYSSAGFDDWFLPSQDEYNEVCLQFYAGNLNKGNWVSNNNRNTWTSTQDVGSEARRATAFNVRTGGTSNCGGAPGLGGSPFGKDTRFEVRPCRYITYDINNPYENVYAQYG
jgi:hypothetical protein